MQKTNGHDRPGEAGRAAAFGILIICAFAGTGILLVYNALTVLGVSEKTTYWVLALLAMLSGGWLIYSLIRANREAPPERTNWPWD